MQSASAVGECTMSYRFNGTVCMDDGEGCDTTRYSCELGFESPIASISVVEIGTTSSCGAGVRVAITWAGAGVSCGEDGVQQTSLIAMDSREQADRLVNALRHLSELCVAARPPDPS